MKWMNQYWIGFVVGLITTLAFGYIYMEQMNLIDTVVVHKLYGLLPKIATVALFPNMALLFILYQLDWWKTAKGVIISMIPVLITIAYFSV